MTCTDVGGRVTDGAGFSVAAEWSDRARTVALRPLPGWCGRVYKPGWLWPLRMANRRLSKRATRGGERQSTEAPGHRIRAPRPERSVRSVRTRRTCFLFSWRLRARRFVGSVTRRRVGPPAHRPLSAIPQLPPQKVPGKEVITKKTFHFLGYSHGFLNPPPLANAAKNVLKRHENVKTVRFVLFEKTRENGAKTEHHDTWSLKRLKLKDARSRPRAPSPAPVAGAPPRRPALLRHLRRRCSSSRTERSLKGGCEYCVRDGCTY